MVEHSPAGLICMHVSFIADLFNPRIGFAFLFRVRIFCAVCAVVGYILSPLDIIPGVFLANCMCGLIMCHLAEQVFGIFGYIDDIALLLCSVVFMTMMYRAIVVARDNN